MKRRATLVAMVAVGMALLSAGSVVAELKSEKLSLTPMIGGCVFEGNQQSERHDGAFSLALGFNATKHWGTEFTLSYVDSESRYGNHSDIYVYLIRWEVLYHFWPEKKLVPYLVAGGGTLIADPEGRDPDPDLMVDYGGGLKYFLTENLALRGDVRHVYEIDDKYNNLIYSFGLLIQFAGPK